MIKVTWSVREPFEDRAEKRSTMLGREEKQVTEKQTEALERLNQGIQESRREVQQRTMNLAQEYFGDSAEVLKQNIRDNRATLEGLPDQIPGGREEAFQAFFQELMDNYSSMEDCINEAQQNVANLDTDQIRRQGEIEATDAARREARERGVDLTNVEGTGSDGRIIVSDVVEAAEAMEDGAGEDGAAAQAAQQTQEAAGQAAGQAQQVAGQATDQAGQVAGQAQDAAGSAAQQAQDTAGQAAQQAQATAGQATGGDGAEEPRATNAARRRAEQLGIDLSTIEGTGSGGLITIKDVSGS